MQTARVKTRNNIVYGLKIKSTIMKIVKLTLIGLLFAVILFTAGCTKSPKWRNRGYWRSCWGAWISSPIQSSKRETRSSMRARFCADLPPQKKTPLTECLRSAHCENHLGTEAAVQLIFALIIGFPKYAVSRRAFRSFLLAACEHQ